MKSKHHTLTVDSRAPDFACGLLAEANIVSGGSWVAWERWARCVLEGRESEVSFSLGSSQSSAGEEGPVLVAAVAVQSYQVGRT